MKIISIQKLFCLALIFMASAAWSQDISVHDPVMIKQKDTYYLYCTGNGISCFSSKDMKNWKPEPAVFQTKPAWTDTVVPDFKNHIWAPDIALHNNVYYLYYSVSAFAKNTSAIGVATNTTLDSKDANYKWVDHGIVIQSEPNRDLWNAIDPNLVFDENNTPWLSFGSFWDGLKMVKLNPDLKSVAKPQVWHTIARRERDFKLPDEDPGNAALEAPFVFKKDGFYYLFLSWDFCCRGEKSTYKVVVGRSKNAIGPFVDQSGKSLFQGGGTPVIEGNKNWAGVGHNGTYTFDGKDYLVFHAYDSNENGRPKLKIKEIKWENGWPKVEPMN